MKRYHRRRTTRWGVTARSPTMVTLHDTWFVRVPMVKWRLDCENCRHLTVVGLHDTGPRSTSPSTGPDRRAARLPVLGSLLWFARKSGEWSTVTCRSRDGRFTTRPLSYNVQCWLGTSGKGGSLCCASWDLNRVCASDASHQSRRKKK